MMKAISSVLLALSLLGCSPSHPTGGGGFLLTTFRDETTPLSEQIYMCISEDGRNWEELNGGAPVLVSDVGEKGVRDSYLLRSHDGEKFWLIATDLCVHWNRNWTRNMQAGSRSITVWESNDLVHWSAPRLALVAPDDAGCVWAPEAIYDDETNDYLVYWASTTGRDAFAKQRIWAAHTKDFRSFSTPFIFIEKANHVIDIDVVRDGDNYYRFMKDDRTKNVSMETAQKLAGPWQEMPQVTAGKMKEFEVPIWYLLTPAKNGQPPVWCLWMDNVGDRIGDGAFGYMPFLSTDLSSGQFTPATDFHFPYALRHGSVLPITNEEMARVRSAYASTKSAGR